jgi:hypothetical protein
VRRRRVHPDGMQSGDPWMRLVRAGNARLPDHTVAVADADGPFGALAELDRLAAAGTPADAVLLEETRDPEVRKALTKLFAERHPDVVVLFGASGRFTRRKGRWSRE